MNNPPPSRVGHRQPWQALPAISKYLPKALLHSAFMLLVTAGIWRTRGETATNVPAGSLADLSVEELMNESVTSVARRETKFEESPAAISVITQDDIRRLGITTIPDALRLVPGLDVAQIDSHEWAVSARGFNNQFANKLLVLIDGRSVYGTGFGGVVWGVQDVVMEDVDRIEVIRGPGASLWGANAVNVVINIITRSAKDTQGTLISVEGGTVDQPMITVRNGGELATNLFYRVYGKFYNRDGMVTTTGQDAPDSAIEGQGGFRLDWEPSDENWLTLQGDLYRDRDEENQTLNLTTLPPPYSENYNDVNYNSGGNVLGRWTHDFSDHSSLTVQAYFDRFKQEQSGAAEKADTADFDAQHRFSLGERNDITWGLGYREVVGNFRGSEFAGWNPPGAHDHLYSSFLQDEIAVLPEQLKLTLGSKLEHNDYTGFEVEPSARLAWTPTEHQTIWAAVSRAVHTPSWTDLHTYANLAVIPTTPYLTEISTLGNPHLESEVETAYELGYRIEVTKHVSFDVAGFYNDYDNLIAPTGQTGTFVIVPPPGSPYVQVDSVDENAGAGHTYGAEVSARWDVTDNWHLTANYSWLEFHLDFQTPYLQGGPENQAQLRSSLDLPRHFELNAAISFVDQYNAPYGLGQMLIPSYASVDVGLVWHATESLELGLWGQNLAQDRHLEFPSYKTTLLTEVPRTVAARITWRF